MAPTETIAVIGAGASGLVTAKYCLEAGFDVVVFEASERIGGVFGLQAGYDDGALVSSKFLTAFSDFRHGPSDPIHLSFTQYEAYLGEYAKAFGVAPRIRFGTNVVRVERVGDAAYDVTVSAPDGGGGAGALATERFSAVAVCSGAHNVPLVPSSSLAGFAGEVLHSSAYKDKAQLRGKRVLVVGSQETAMDLAYRAIKAPAASLAMVVRRGFLSVPHVLAGEPLDCLITNAFEATWQHEWVERLRLKWHMSTFFIRLGFLLGSGSHAGWNQWVGGVRYVRRGYNCESTLSRPSAACARARARAPRSLTHSPRQTSPRRPM